MCVRARVWLFGFVVGEKESLENTSLFEEKSYSKIGFVHKYQRCATPLSTYPFDVFWDFPVGERTWCVRCVNYAARHHFPTLLPGLGSVGGLPSPFRRDFFVIRIVRDMCALLDVLCCRLRSEETVRFIHTATRQQRIFSRFLRLFFRSICFVLQRIKT